MKTFEELGVSPEIRRAIEEMGYACPMPVQEEVIPYLLGENNDVVALAQTGTGKTAAFGLPLIQQINVNNRIPQSLILCPTRELCLQIAGDLNDYSKYIDGLRVLPVYGGSSIESQIRALKRGVHIIVATPGRLLDLMERKTVSLSTIQNVVMDEADEMLNMGFTDSINAILADVPQERNTLLFSATMSPEIARISKKYLHNAKEITIGRKNESTSNVKHVVFTVHAKDKYAALKRIVDYYPQIYGIIFCRTRKETQEIADKLMQEGYNADSLHGELMRLLLPKDPDDDRNVIIEIRGGAGGEEASLFAASLYRMYTMYAETQGWKQEVLSANETELGGYKEISFSILGEGAYSRLKYESGVHRVQRVPETESQGRIHTSTVTVAVLVEADEVAVDINPTDLRIDVFRASGAGGQHINKTESAVRITHIPTGLVVECQDERSQYKNKDKAMKILRSRLYEQMLQEQNDKIASERRMQVGTGDRSERIRTYNFPQGRMTDHRIGLTLYRLEDIMNGNLDEVFDALATADELARLAGQQGEA